MQYYHKLILEMDLVFGKPFQLLFVILQLYMIYQKYFDSRYIISPDVLTDGTNSTIRFNVLI